MELVFEDFDFAGFWEDSDYARKEYVEKPLTPEMVRSVEKDLGFRLPAAYVAFMGRQNGGIPTRTCFATATRTSWAEDHVAISGFLGIGRKKTYSLLGGLGSQFMQEEWGYPSFGICICNCPSAGHDMIMLDYRACGQKGEPSVVHVDQEDDFRVTFLAPDFETFVRGLVPSSVYEPSEEDVAEELLATRRTIREGAFSTSLAALIARTPDPGATESTLRRLLDTVVREKGFFSLHADPGSHLVYDVLFDLYSAAHAVLTKHAYLEAYPSLLVFSDGEIKTGGFAPGFLDDWIDARLANGDIVEVDGKLRLSDAHQRAIRAELATLARKP